MKKQSLERSSKTVLLEDKDKDVRPYSLQWYRSDPQEDNFVVHVKPMWSLSVSKKDITKKGLKEFVEDQIKKDVKRGHLGVEVVSDDHVEVIFKAEQWMRDNFLKRPDVKFQPPRTLNWRFKKLLPDGLMGHADWIMVEKWLKRRFKKFLKDHQSRIFDDKLKLFKRANMDWFDVTIDLQMNRIYLRLKTTVMMTIALGAYATSQAVGKSKKVDSFGKYDL